MYSAHLKDEFILSALSRKDDMDKIGAKHNRNDRLNEFVGLFRQVIRDISLCFINGEIHYFDGKIYLPIDYATLNSCLYNALIECEVSPLDAKKLPEYIVSVVYEKQYTEDKDLIAFQNCVYRISSDDVTEFSAEQIVTYLLPYDFSRNAPKPIFDKFLSEVLPDQSERLRLQQLFGMVFLNRKALSVEICGIMVGDGANGKSTVFDVITATIGQSRVSMLTPEQLKDEKQVVGLKGKLLNFSPDVKISASFTSALKALISGQSVEGWRLYSGSEQIDAPPLVFCCNQIPEMEDRTPAFYRRLLLIRFGVTIPPERQDKSLARKIISKERAGVMNWILEGRRMLIAQRGNFTPSDVGEQYKQKIIARNNLCAGDYMALQGYCPCPVEGQEPYRVKCAVLANDIGCSVRTLNKELTESGYRKVHTAMGDFYELYRKDNKTNIN